MIHDELRRIAEEIADEIDGAENYLHAAMHHKGSNPTVSKKYAEMADQEAGHASNLYAIGLSLAQASEDATAIAMWTTWSKPMLDDSMVKIRAMQTVYQS